MALLTIAIPTYNRADILDNTLSSIIADPSFDDRVEILVSDNCSTDHTPEVVSKYPQVKYFRNEENVRDKNFPIAVSRGTCKYVHLHNDTVTFNEGKLAKILSVLEQEADTGRNVLFINNNDFIQNKQVVISNKNELVKTISFHITWIANFGVWGKDFQAMTDVDKFSDTQLQQIEWLFSIVSLENRKTLVVADNFYTTYPLQKKGSYNIFDVFVTNYFASLDRNKISRFALEVEKYRLLRYFICPWLILLSKQTDYQYELDNANKTIFSKYWYEFYYYIFVVYVYLRKYI